MTVRSLLGVVLIAALASLGHTSTASAARPCDSAALQDGTVVRVATLRIPCGRGRDIAVTFFERVQAGDRFDGKTGDGSIYYSVEGLRCFPGLGGSQTWCKSDARWVFASTRPEDHPVGWTPLRRRSTGSAKGGSKGSQRTQRGMLG
jgi:hypothetical protein